ncbi:hypothetical protein NB688_003893 [Xanthomonas sacchari]|uniref:DNA-binding protein n=2 Tax=Xanthomonas sacchari TaxID=56458 RepID=A0ABT3DWE6_9XANT|nr:MULTISPECIES: hypothetical protein [Xanthomonas]MCW0399843.1 hypothetical protein [Xanthomonas sacchari]MCW0421727.1 hypothetical protein [Xanthomonas sacchari]MDQ7760221.1 hypothetical protein [Xanthomonas sontii]TYD35063.1 hypothetical protein CEK63_09640 [Xanthomonas sontii]UYK72749.1 hypothetical protein NG828_21640 [Xanthomonas sacchari]
MNAAFPLPPALQPWHAWLAWFDADIAAMVGDWLLRLDPLLGRGAARMQRGVADPDGIDDLRRRGPYERLVLSEWAVADLLPDEFLRRAAHYEHLFLAPKLARPRSDALVLALFDAGPAQRGAPRLLHVAMWILLARRAQAAGARFAWGVLQRPGEVHEEASAEALRALLQARTHALATQTEHTAWQRHLAGHGQAAIECWWMTAGDVAPGRGDHQVRIRHGFDDRLSVSVRTPRAHRQLTLGLPDAGRASRLLRGEFLLAPAPLAMPGAVVATESLNGRLSLRQPPLFSIDGRHLALPLAGTHQAVLLTLREEGRRKKAKPRYSAWPASGELLCGVIANKELAGVAAVHDGLYFWKMPWFQPVARPPADAFAAAPGAASWLHCAWLRASKSQTQRVVILDAAGRLLSWTNASTRPGRDMPAHVQVDDRVLAMQQIDGQRLLYARCEDDRLRVNYLHREGNIELLTQLAVPARPVRLLVRGQVREGHWRGALCLEYPGQHDDGGICRLYQGGPQDGFSELELRLPAGAKLLGPVQDPQRPERSRLLLLRPDRRTVIAIGEQGQEIVYQASNDISAASVAPDGSGVALVDLAGQLRVLGEGGGKVLLQAQGQRGDDRDD